MSSSESPLDDQEIALALADRMAIMDKAGRIRQIGAPRDIFDNPVDEFVFTFMGVANFIAVRRQGGRAVLAVSGQGTGLTWAGDARFGDRAALGLRPSDIEVTRNDEAARGIVKRRNLLGADIDLRIEVDGAMVRARLDTREAMEQGLMFEEGENCGLIFHAPLWFDPKAAETGAHPPGEAGR